MSSFIGPWILHDRRDPQTIDLVSHLHVTEKFHTISRFLAAVTRGTYSVRVDNVSKLLVAQGWFGAGHGRVVYFRLALMIWLQYAVLVAEGLLMWSLPTAQILTHLALVLGGAELVHSMMLLFVWGGGLVGHRHLRSHLAAKHRVLIHDLRAGHQGACAVVLGYRLVGRQVVLVRHTLVV